MVEVEEIIIFINYDQRQGYNWPNPHPDVISTLKKLREKGIIVSLCTGKGTFAIKEIVEAARLNNIYIEVYTIDNYYIERKKINENLKRIHAAILYRQPIITESFIKLVKDFNVVKIMSIPKDNFQKQLVINIFDPYKDLLSLQWGVHPIALPAQFGLITRKGISKRQGAITISKTTNIKPENFLGVGDGLSDWNFMEICGYAGAMGNASQELKNLVKSKKEFGFIGPTVDENGVLEIFKHFGL